MASVSIILPTYNRARLLPSAIRSVLDQSFQDFELIIVDDCSTDKTDEILKTLSDPRFVIVRHEMNRGYAAAINTGLAKATGEWLCFLDSDDAWHPDRLRLQITAVQDKSNDVVGSFCSVRFNFKGQLSYTIHEGFNPSGELIGDVWHRAGAGVVLVHRRIYEVVGGFDENLKTWQDIDWLMSICEKMPEARFVLLPEPLLDYHFTEGSMSDQAQSTRRSATSICEKRAGQFKQNRRIAGMFCYLIGKTLGKSSDYFNGVWWIIRSLRFDPLRPKAYIACAIVALRLTKRWRI